MLTTEGRPRSLLDEGATWQCLNQQWLLCQGTHPIRLPASIVATPASTLIAIADGRWLAIFDQMIQPQK